MELSEATVWKFENNTGINLLTKNCLYFTGVPKGTPEPEMIVAVIRLATGADIELLEYSMQQRSGRYMADIRLVCDGQSMEKRGKGTTSMAAWCSAFRKACGC